jgi:hypothetical protein
VHASHYSWGSGALLEDSPKSSEGNMRLYSRGWENGEADAGRRKLRDWMMLAIYSRKNREDRIEIRL